MTFHKRSIPGVRRSAARRECLDKLLIFGCRQLERVLRVYVRHYNEHRPHRALELQAPDPRAMPSTSAPPRRISDRDPTPRPARRTHPRIRSRRSMRSN
jgi:hypothetical protein